MIEAKLCLLHNEKSSHKKDENSIRILHSELDYHALRIAQKDNLIKNLFRYNRIVSFQWR
jgi:hypothetical protein